MTTLPYSCLQATAESTFFDECELGAIVVGGWGEADTGAGTPVFDDAIPCGFQPMNKGESRDGAQVPFMDAKLRLPVGTDITNIDRVRLTSRHGTAITPQLYTIEGPPELGPSAMVLNLKLVTGNSVR